MPAMKPKSRRWADAAATALAALQDLRAVQAEYQDMRETLVSGSGPGGPEYRKLRRMSTLNLDLALGIVEAANDAEPPSGIGTD